MRFIKIISIGLGLFIGLVFFSIYIGIPTIQDRYLEQATETPKFRAFSDSLSTCDIAVFPEVLDRLLIEAKFGHVNGGQEIIKDFKIKVFADNVEQERIFDIHLATLIEPTVGFDEIRINDFNELPDNSRYRDFAFTIRPQYKLDNDTEFELRLTAILLDTLRQRERTVGGTYRIINDKEFKFEKFRVH